MKKITTVLLVILFLGTLSCRDTKKEEAETKANIEKIEAIEKEAEDISTEIEKEADALEKELEELENI